MCHIRKGGGTRDGGVGVAEQHQALHQREYYAAVNTRPLKLVSYQIVPECFNFVPRARVYNPLVAIFEPGLGRAYHGGVGVAEQLQALDQRLEQRFAVHQVRPASRESSLLTTYWSESTSSS